MKMYEYQYFKTSKLWVLGSNPNGITNKRVLLANNKQITLFLVAKIGETLAR